MILLTTGSRWWNDPVTLYERMDEWLRTALLTSPTRLLVMHGACPPSPTRDKQGADYHVDQWAALHQRSVVVARRPADWDTCVPGRGPRGCPDDGGVHRRPRRDDDWCHPGRLDSYCPKAGARRNAAMVAEVRQLVADGGHRAARCLAFERPSVVCRGTRNCVSLARGAELKVVSYLADRTPRVPDHVR